MCSLMGASASVLVVCVYCVPCIISLSLSLSLPQSLSLPLSPPLFPTPSPYTLPSLLSCTSLPSAPLTSVSVTEALVIISSVATHVNETVRQMVSSNLMFSLHVSYHTCIYSIIQLYILKHNNEMKSSISCSPQCKH